MDSQSGRFVSEDQATPEMPRVGVGQTVELVDYEGHPLKVTRIDDRTLLLQLMSEADRRVEALEALGSDEFKRLENTGVDPWIPHNRHERRKQKVQARRPKKT